MNVQLKVRRIGTVMAVASCLWFATALTAVGDSPLLRFPGAPDGVYYPLIPAQGLYAASAFLDSRNDFLRTNPDGSHWFHFQAVNSYVGIGSFNFEDFSFDPIFSGSGKITGSFTVAWDKELKNWTADLRHVEFRWEATLTDKDGVEYPFFLHVVVKDGVFLRDDVRFAPLGLGE
jgi:hypothetical protein